MIVMMTVLQVYVFITVVDADDNDNDNDEDGVMLMITMEIHPGNCEEDAGDVDYGNDDEW